MARRLTIRRVGSFLPTVSLVVLLFFCITVAWLTVSGVPDSVLKYLTDRAAAEGICLKLDALKLEPSRGLALRAEGVRMYAKEGDALPLAQADSVSVGINATALLRGTFRADTVHLKNGTLSLPTQPDAAIDPLTAEKIDFSARIGKRGLIYLTSASLRLQQVPVQLRGGFRLPTEAEAPAEGAQPFDAAAFTAEYSGLFAEIRRIITEQNWQPEELPELDVRIAGNSDAPQISARLLMPRYDVGALHLRSAVADISYRDETLLISSLRFSTVEPDATVSLQGGYSIRERTLSFSLHSNAAVLDVLRSFGNEGTLTALAVFSHPVNRPPSIDLQGDVSFAEDFTPTGAHVRADLAVDELTVGTRRIDRTELALYYDDGNFNINNLRLIFPTGSVQLTASAQNGTGHAHLKADVPAEEILQLINQFTDEEVRLPEGVVLNDSIRLDVQAELTTIPLDARHEHWQNYIPGCRRLKLSIGTASATVDGTSLQNPSALVVLDGIAQDESLIPTSVEYARAEVSADGVQTADFTAEKTQLTASFQQADLQQPCIGQLNLEATADSLAAGDTRIEGITAVVRDMRDLRPDALTPDALLRTGNLTAEARRVSYNGVCPGSLRVSLSPADGAGNGRVAALLTDGDNATLRLEASPELSSDGSIAVRNIGLECNPAALAPLAELFGVTLSGMEYPEALTLGGCCLFSAETGQLRTAELKLVLPRLVRTPEKTVPFRGMRIPIAADVSAELNLAADGGYDYAADVCVTHETGQFNGRIAGSTGAERLRVTGNNTIRVDVIDALLDVGDAHAIIRDFRFTPESSTNVSNIDTTVDYSNGTVVDSYCDALIRNSGYMLCGLEENADGTEKVRTDLGNDPFTYTREASCGVKVRVRLDSKAADGTPLPDETCITLTHPRLVYDNRPWFRRQKFDTGTRETVLSGDAVIIDVENSFVELCNVNGTVYPAYSLGMFYADLQHFLEDVILPAPARVRTQSCVFPIYSDCKRPMSGTILAEAPAASGFRFLGTTIPLRDFSGYIYLTDDYVQLDRMNAKSWGGVLDAVVRIGITGAHTSFDGYVKASNMDLRRIAASYGSEQASALCNGEIRFRTPSPEIDDLKAYGKVDISNGDLLTLSIFRPVGAFVSDIPGNFSRLEKVATGSGQVKKPGFFSRMMTRMFSAFGNTVNKLGDGVGTVTYYVPGANHVLSYDLQSAYAEFNIAGGHLTTSYMKAQGYNLNVRVEADVDLETLMIHGNIWPKISSLPTVILSPLTFLSDFMVDIVILGQIDDLDWHFALDRRLNNHEVSATDEPPADNPKPLRR